MTIIAFHGDYANPNMLRQDSGLGDLVDHYHSGHELESAMRLCLQYPDLFLIGYSRGGGVIADLSLRLNNIRAAVLYESPLGQCGTVAGMFPVQFIWNKNGYRNSRQADRMMAAWRSGGRHYEELTGAGRHIRFDPNAESDRRLRHGWDQTLNPQILKFLRKFGGVGRFVKTPR